MEKFYMIGVLILSSIASRTILGNSSTGTEVQGRRVNLTIKVWLYI